MTRLVPLLLLLLAMTGCPAQTVVRFTPSVGYFEQDTPVAAGFAYAFRAPVILRSAKSIDALPVQPVVVEKSFETQIHDYESPRENSIVPVFYPKPSKQAFRKEPLYQDVTIPQVLKTQYHSQDELGQYAYGYVHNDASHHEERSLNGGVTGSYSYYDDLGRKQSANYIADGDGFRVQATNLHPYLPEPVSQTPEVLAATKAHLLAVKKERSRKLLGKHIHVGISDTPEVAAAREAHLLAFDQIKRAHQNRWKRSSRGSYGSPHSQKPYAQRNGHQSQHFGFSSSIGAPYAAVPQPVTPTPAVQAATHAHLQAAQAAHTYGTHVGIPDTPAVAAAKEAHHYAYKKIQAQHAQRWKRSAYRSPDHGAQSQSYNAPGFQTHEQSQTFPRQQYASNAQNIHLPVTPTPEVQSATYDHLQALNSAHKYGGNVHVGIPDTPEVAAAKNAHHYAYKQIQADHMKRW